MGGGVWVEMAKGSWLLALDGHLEIHYTILSTFEYKILHNEILKTPKIWL